MSLSLKSLIFAKKSFTYPKSSEGADGPNDLVAFTHLGLYSQSYTALMTSCQAARSYAVERNGYLDEVRV